MTTIEINDGKLHLRVRGLDIVLALKKELTVPLSHITRAEVGVAADALDRLHHSIRMPGTAIPGVVIAGSYRESGRWMFWDIHSGEQAITIWLTHEHYDAIVVDVADPATTVGQINGALDHVTPTK